MTTASNTPLAIKRQHPRYLVLFLSALTALLVMQSHQQHRQFQDQQQRQMQNLLKQQLAMAVEVPLQQNDQQQLQWLAQSFARAPLIRAVWIHKLDGTLMAESGEITDNALVLASEVKNSQVLGYLRIHVNREIFIKPIQDQQQKQLQWHQLSLLLALITGMLLARSVSRCRSIR